MEIKVVGLLKEVDAVVDVDVSGCVESFEYMGEKIDFKDMVRVYGKLKRAGSKYYILDGTVEAKLIMECSSCMELYEYDVEFPIEFHFAEREKAIDDEVDMYYTNGDIIELDEERKAAMVSNLLVVLCGNKDAQPIVNSGSLY